MLKNGEKNPQEQDWPGNQNIEIDGSNELIYFLAVQKLSGDNSVGRGARNMASQTGTKFNRKKGPTIMGEGGVTTQGRGPKPKQVLNCPSSRGKTYIIA